MNDNDVRCDISQCQIYLRNNRQRELKSIECQDEQLSMFIDIIDTYHCFFVHSFDIGYRLPKTFNVDSTESKYDQQITNKTTAYDPKMFELKRYLSTKRTKLETIRGSNRLNNSKFMTNITSYCIVL